MDKIVKKAYTFARKKHGIQKDDAGHPAFEHPCQAFNIIAMVTEDSNILAATLLHDTIEDTLTTYDELVKEFNRDVADLVMEVTHEGDKKHGYTFPRLHTQRGIMIKFADRLSNISRMEVWEDKRREHYLKKSKFWR